MPSLRRGILEKNLFKKEYPPCISQGHIGTHTHSKGNFVIKNLFETFVLKISGIQNKSDSDLV